MWSRDLVLASCSVQEDNEVLKSLFLFPCHASDLDGRIKRGLKCKYRDLFKPSEVTHAVPVVGAREERTHVEP